MVCTPWLGIVPRNRNQTGPLLDGRSGPVFVLSEFWIKQGYSVSSWVTTAPPIAATTAEAFTTL
jgi:hypothetical protein